MAELNVVQKSAGFLGAANLLKMAWETGVEPATSSLGKRSKIVY